MKEKKLAIHNTKNVEEVEKFYDDHSMPEDNKKSIQRSRRGSTKKISKKKHVGKNVEEESCDSFVVKEEISSDRQINKNKNILVVSKTRREKTKNIHQAVGKDEDKDKEAKVEEVRSNFECENDNDEGEYGRYHRGNRIGRRAQIVEEPTRAELSVEDNYNENCNTNGYSGEDKEEEEKEDEENEEEVQVEHIIEAYQVEERYEESENNIVATATPHNEKEIRKGILTKERKRFVFIGGSLIGATVFLFTLFNTHTPLSLSSPSASPSKSATPSTHPTGAPIASLMPTLAPTNIEGIKVKILAKGLGFNEDNKGAGDNLFGYASGTAERRALDFILEEDDVDFAINENNILPRFLFVLFYFTLNGDGWHSCSGTHPESECWLGHCSIFVHSLEQCPEENMIRVSGVNWLNRDHHCRWAGIDCHDEEEGGDGSSLNVKLMAGSNDLSGTLPSLLSLVPGLTTIDLPNNKIKGTIPSEYGTLSNLTLLRLNNNDLSGTIPDELYNATKMEVLSLERNKISGTISTNVGKLQSLNRLNFRRTELTGTIPTEIGNLKQLKVLDLSDNGQRPQHVIIVDYFRSSYDFLRLNGTIPTEMGMLSLTELDLSTNQLTGSIPSTFYRLDSLKRFDVRSNRLDGTLKDDIGNLTNLVNLDLKENNFSGTMPETIASLERLQDFVIYANSFTGTLPNSLYTMRNLITLDLSYNSFHGTLKDDIGNLKNLFRLDLKENNFSGTIPETIASLERLTYLILSRNNFTGVLNNTEFCNVLDRFGDIETDCFLRFKKSTCR